MPSRPCPLFLAALAAFWLAVSAASASDLTKTAELADLQTPPSPGFMILGTTPSGIQHPASPRDISVSLLGLASGSQVPAVEFKPFWTLQRIQTMAFERYFSQDPEEMFFRNLALSVAKASLADGAGNSSAGSGTSFGVGARTLLRFGNAGLLEQFKAAAKKAQELNDAIIGLPAGAHTDPAQALKELTALLPTLRSLQSKLPEGGLVVEPGFALQLDYPGDDFEHGQVSKMGAWLTASHGASLFDSGLRGDVLGRYRYVWLLPAYQHFNDMGGQVRFTYSGLALAYEYQMRNSADDTGNMDQVVYVSKGLVEYKLNADTYIVGSFGREQGRQKTGLVSLLGVNMAFGPKATIEIPKY